jgi:DNA repair exonuclease SbcCD nuclease subunit
MMRKIISSLSLLLLLAFSAPAQYQLPILSNKSLNIMIANDMGRRGESEQKNIANLMGEVADENKIAFLAVAGDPIHDEGVKSVDDEEWKLKIEDIYTAPSLHKIPWYVISGNHEYRGNVQAILDYSRKSERWNAPSRYFSLTEKIGDSGEECLFVFIDTSPLIDKYRGTSDGLYSDAGQQDMGAQLAWLQKTLELSNARWKIVIGHHPVYAETSKEESERTDMQARIDPILKKNKVDAYFCGHIHNFQHIQLPSSTVHYVVNSSASQSRSVEKIEGTQFCNPNPGFAICSVDEESFSFFLINHKGEEVYSYTITK